MTPRGQHQQNGNGNGPALVKGCQAEKNHHHRKSIEQGRLRTRHPFLVGDAGPVKTDALRQFRHDLFHGPHGVAAALPRRRFPPDVQRREGVVPFEPGRGGSPASGGGRCVGDHLPRRIPNVNFVQVFRRHAVRSVCLNVHPLYPASLDKIIHIGAAEGGRKGVVNGGNGDPEGAGLFPIHIDPVFGDIFHAVGPDRGQSRVLGDHAEELIASSHQRFVADTAPVLQLKVKPLGRCPVR